MPEKERKRQENRKPAERDRYFHLKNAPILILDEPTSALDPIAEYELFSRLDELSENKLALFISHRLSSTKFCDRIIVLSDEKITETGCHDDLMRRQGEYYELFNSQAKYCKEG